MTQDSVRVGALTVGMAAAACWVAEYFDAAANRYGQKPYAFPAYDRLVTRSGPDELNDGDLLAPSLLNVRLSIRAFYGLQGMRRSLEEGLARTWTGVTLDSAVEDGSVRDRMAYFVGQLDGTPASGVHLTTLTEVLHRKRPRFMPLHDRFVAACYLGSSPRYPVQPVESRTWVDYWTQMSTAINADLNGQRGQWGHLATMAPRDVPRLRLLDVVARNAGKASAQNE